jgi:hypothetical protein
MALLKSNIWPKILLAVASTLLSLTIAGGVFINHYAREFHKAVTGGSWPVNSYRYNGRTRNFELTPGFSQRLLDQSSYLKTHELGFRIPVFADRSTLEKRGMLSLGCSFTFGWHVDAEKTFSYIAGERLGLPAYNYGVSSYSYASSVLQLRDLERQGVLDQLEPSVILLGAGPWLVSRSRSPYYPTPDIQLAYPYIEKKNGEVGIVFPPEFISVKHAIGFATSTDYFETDNKRVELTLDRRLLLGKLVPRVLYAKFRRKSFRNRLETYELYRFVIGSIREIAERSNTRFAVLYMPSRKGHRVDEGFLKALREFDDVILIDGIAALKEYGAEEAVLAHPDEQAHAAYADAIVEQLAGQP